MEVMNPETGELIETDEDAIAAAMTPDDDEGDPDPEPDPEREPEPASGPTPEDVERAYKKLGQSVKVYVAAVARTLDFQIEELSECPVCGTLPHPGFVNINDAGRIPEPVKDATMLFLGFPREQDYEPDPELRECSACKGRGEVMTGSRVPANVKRACPNCSGYGYFPPPGGNQPAAAANGSTHVPAGVDAAPLSAPEVDHQAEPRILPDGRPNPNYGKWPQYKVQVQPWGVTAGLTAQDAPAPAA